MVRGKVTPELLKKVKDAVNIVQVVGEHVVLKKSGSNYSGLCPFHSERSPSFSVSEQKQLYHCYGCKKGGDLVSFVMELHGLSFIEAVEELADRGRVALPKDVSGATGDPKDAERRSAASEKLALAFKLNRFAAAFYHHQLKRQPGFQDYLRKRGVGDFEGELMRNFYVGAAMPSWDDLSTHLLAKQAPLPLAVELGLIRPSTKAAAAGKVGPGYFDLFRNRAMFPILDLRGKIAGFGGRLLPDAGVPGSGASGGGDNQPKYLNSPESLVFHKSKLAFGLFQAQKHIREKDEIILVEGYFDVLALHAAGFKNVVATCGTSLTPDHLRVFLRLGTKVTVLFDGDSAGINATERAMEVGLEHGVVLYGCTIPGGQDPDEALFDAESGQARSGGREAMTALLSGAQPLLDQRIGEEVRKAAAGPEAKAQAVKKIALWLARFRDPVGRAIRIQTVVKSLDIPAHLLESPSDSRGGKRDEGIPAVTVRTPTPIVVNPRKPTGKRAAAGISPREKILLVAIARGAQFSPLLAESRAKFPPNMAFADLFESPAARSFVASVFSDPAEWERFRALPETFLTDELDPQVRSILTEAWVAHESPFTEEDVVGALNRALGRSWAQFSQQIKSALADAEVKKDAKLQSELMKDYLDVQRKMKEFITLYDEA